MRRFIFAILIFAATSAFAQSPGLTWIRYYEAMPGKEQELARLLIESSKPTFEKLLADKTVAAYGVVVPASHTADTWTHAVYVTVNDWGAFDRFLNTMAASSAQLSPAEMKKLDESFMTALRPHSYRDVVLRHLSQAPLPTAPPAAKAKYIGTDTYVVKPGRFEDAVDLFNEWAKPVFSDLTAKGRLGPWGLSMQEVVTMPGWTHMVWYFMTDLGAIDQMNAANMALPPMKLKGFDVRLRDLSEPEKHQGQLLRIVHQAP